MLNFDHIFNEAHKPRLTRIFTDLVDFIHEHNLEQIVSIGPSAAPFAKAIAHAYQRRHGKPLSVVNLGKVGEQMGEFQESERKEALQLLLKHKPRFRFDRKTLLFDEITQRGLRFRDISKTFQNLGLNHKTAVLMNAIPHLLEYTPDFGPICGYDEDSIALSNSISSLTGVSAKLTGLREPASKLRLKNFLKHLHYTLNEIALQVPRKEQKEKAE